MNDTSMPFWGHVVELRRRLIVAMLALIAATMAAFSFVEPAAAYIMAPAGAMDFVFLSPPELFTAYIRIALMAGLAISSPIILFELWLFVRPGLEKRERRALLAALFFGAAFFAGGASFAFFVIIPFCLRFFQQYQNESVTALYSFGEYLGFISTMVFSFGLAFELPVATTLLAALGIVKGSSLVKARGVAIVLIFVLAAVITPPDVVSQLLLGVPMVLLFELSLILALGQEKRRAKRLSLAD